MKKERVIPGIYIFGMVFVASVLLLAGCGDDESFSPVAKNRGYDYAYTTAKDLSKTPCNEMREGREAVIGRSKDRYECEFDYRDSVYLWVGYDDTLTAEGREFHRAESSSSSSRYSSSSSYSSSSYSSSSYSSSYSSSSSSSRSSSSSSRSYSSSSRSLTQKGEQFNSDIKYGTMTDPRDGKTYKTVVVEGQTWMAENLNYSDGIDEKTYCADDVEENCEIYGRMYDRGVAMNSSSCAYESSCSLGAGPIQGICPDGWHIPTVSEGQSLINLANSTAAHLRSAKGWGSYSPGDDIYGLSFVGAGNYDSKELFEDVDNYEFMWLYKASSAQYYLLIKPSSLEIFDWDGYKVYNTVRCVKGEAAPVSSSSSSYSSSSVSSSSVSSSSVSSSSRELSTPLTVKGEQFNPDIDYGTMTDPRDGKTYKTVVVEGKTWMAENLNFVGNEDFPLAEQYSLCPYDEEENCELYGRLYTREAAMNSDTCAYNTSCSLADPLQGVCPTGWHIPSLTEATDLKDLASGSFLTLISAKGWGNDTLSVYSGDDTYGLSFLPAGDKSGDDYKYFGTNAFMWANIPDDEQRYFVINASEKKAFIHSGYSVNVLYLSVRCVKDE